MAQVNFDEKEFEALNRLVNRLLDHRNKTQARAVRRKEAEYKILASLSKKLLHGPNKDLLLKRPDLRGIESLCKINATLLQNTIIPGYQDKVAKESDIYAKERLQGYLNRSIEALKIYNQILSKVQRLL